MSSTIGRQRKTINGRAKWMTSMVMAASLAMLHSGYAAAADEEDARDGSQGGMRVIGLTDDGHLVRFRSNAPRSSRDLGESRSAAATATTPS